MEIKFENTVDDYYKLDEYLIKTIPYRIFTYKAPYYLYPAVSIYIYISYIRNVDYWDTYVYINAICIIILNILFFKYVPILYKNFFLKKLKRESISNLFLLRNLTVHFSDDTIIVSNNITEKIIKKEEIYKIIEINSHIFFLNNRYKSYLIIPKDRLTNENVDFLKSILNKWL